jgi:hypothetical protein
VVKGCLKVARLTEHHFVRTKFRGCPLQEPPEAARRGHAVTGFGRPTLPCGHTVTHFGRARSVGRRFLPGQTVTHPGTQRRIRTALTRVRGANSVGRRTRSHNPVERIRSATRDAVGRRFPPGRAVTHFGRPTLLPGASCLIGGPLLACRWSHSFELAVVGRLDRVAMGRRSLPGRPCRPNRG